MDVVQGGFVMDYQVAASDIIYEGSYVEVLAAGHIQPAGVGSSLQGAGIALETVDNSAGSAGDKTCKVLVGCVVADALTATVANIGDAVYASDDQTLTVTASTNAIMGWMLQITGTNTALIKLKYPGQPIS